MRQLYAIIWYYGSVFSWAGRTLASWWKPLLAAGGIPSLALATGFAVHWFMLSNWPHLKKWMGEPVNEFYLGLAYVIAPALILWLIAFFVLLVYAPLGISKEEEAKHAKLLSERNEKYQGDMTALTAERIAIESDLRSTLEEIRTERLEDRATIESLSRSPFTAAEAKEELFKLQREARKLLDESSNRIDPAKSEPYIDRAKAYINAALRSNHHHSFEVALRRNSHDSNDNMRLKHRVSAVMSWLTDTIPSLGPDDVNPKYQANQPSLQ